MCENLKLDWSENLAEPSPAPSIQITCPILLSESPEWTEDCMGVDNPVFVFEEAEQHDLNFLDDGSLSTLHSGRQPSNFSSVFGKRDSLTVPDNSHAGSRRDSLECGSFSKDSTPISQPTSDQFSKMGYGQSPRVSTHSAWSDLARWPQQEADSVSLIGSFSLSNVSATLSERVHELVRAFSSRTQRVKEKNTQLPTPSSSLSSLDALSVASGKDQQPPQRQHRLNSFLPMDSQPSEFVSGTGSSEFFIRIGHCQIKLPKCLKSFRFPSVIDQQSKLYVSWLALVTLAFLYNCWVIPLRGIFDYQNERNNIYWLTCDYLSDFIYLLDIVVFKMRVQFINEGNLERDRKVIRKSYLKGLLFKFDLLSLMPLDFLYIWPKFRYIPWLRLFRLLKIHTFWEFYDRCDKAVSSAYTIRILKTMTYMLYLIHIETCGYYAVSKYEGIGTNRWVYNGTGNAYIRCFYLAAKTATSIGNNPKPTNQLEFIFMTVYWLSGVFVFALLVGQIRDIVEAAGQVEANYRKQMDITFWYMKSLNLPKEMQEKVRTWFNYNWEQQKTLDENSLLESLPRKVKTDLAISVHFNTLSKVQIFQDCDKNLLYDLILKLKPVLCLPHDIICQKGTVGKEMYIVSQGQVEVVGGPDGQTVLATLHKGSVFGEISLLALAGGQGNRRTADVRSKGFTNLFTLSKADFEEAMRDYPEAHKHLKKRAKKLLKVNAKLEKQEEKKDCEEIIRTPPETPKLLKTVIQVMNPESVLIQKLDTVKRVLSRQSSIRPEIHTSSSSDEKSNSCSGVNFSGSIGSISLSDIPNDENGDSLSGGEDDVFVDEDIQLVEEDEHKDDEEETADKPLVISVHCEDSAGSDVVNTQVSGLGGGVAVSDLPDVESRSENNLPWLLSNKGDHCTRPAADKTIPCRKISVHSMTNGRLPSSSKPPTPDPRIPAENRVTCAAEIHQEKSVTPSSVGGEDADSTRSGRIADSTSIEETKC